MQWRHHLVAVQIAVAAVAHDELVVCIEGAPSLHPLPLISVGDRVGEDLLVGSNGALVIRDCGRIAFPSLSQAVKLPFAHGDKDNTEHGDKDDQQ